MNQITEQKNAIEVKNLNFFYGKFQGLKNVSMNIAERKVTAFIGPSFKHWQFDTHFSPPNNPFSSVT